MSTPPDNAVAQWMVGAAKELTSIWHETINRAFKSNDVIEDKTTDHFAAVIAKHAPSSQPSGAGKEVVEKLRADLAMVLSYLGNGGLFNPEFMEHDKVRDMVMNMRDHITAAVALIEQEEQALAVEREWVAGLTKDNGVLIEAADNTKAGARCISLHGRNEKLQKDLATALAERDFFWKIISECMEQLEMKDMGPSMMRGEIQEWLLQVGYLKEKEVKATDRATLLQLERDSLKAQLALAREDGEMLDWLEKKDPQPYYEDGKWRIPYLMKGEGGFGGGVGHYVSNSLRGVVAIARDAGKGET